MEKKKIAVVLSGCGVMDGSEIHEAVTAMLAIEQQGGVYHCFAPEGEQRVVMNHATKQPSNEIRRMPAEAARIARGDISSLKSFNVSNYDAVLFPGGMGAVLNLCDFANQGKDCAVHPDVERVVKEMHAAGKPIVALCIAPVLITRILGDITVTIGNDPETCFAIKAMGGTPEICSSAQVCIDRKNKIITTPCYMLDKSLKEVAQSTSNAVRDLMDMLK
ncbi:MAG: isoprenoid biosynthesis glyoxalase ElbB [Alphaproteobacteria bacterium]|nr:isoprenoid biosynthesis glyoxalase ElbB [Alphaproteobacteria bacterium]